MSRYSEVAGQIGKCFSKIKVYRDLLNPKGNELVGYKGKVEPQPIFIENKMIVVPRKYSEFSGVVYMPYISGIFTKAIDNE